MKVAYAFLIGNCVNQPDIWAEYFDGDEDVYVHAYKDHETVSLPFNHILVRQAPTSWEKTLEAHFVLMESFLKGDCDWLVLVSESCIPLSNKTYIETKIINGQDKWTFLEKHPTKKYKRFWNLKNTFRKTYHISDIRSAEQWWILSRSTIEVLYNNKDTILHELRNSYADNEMLLTYAFRYIKNYSFDEGRHFYIDWSRSNSRRHPWVHPEVIQSKYHNTEHLFLRKVDKKTNVKTMKEYDKKIAIHLHAYYPNIAREMLQKFVQHFKLPYDIFITHPENIKSAQKKWISHKNATYIPVENKGFDIKPFIDLSETLSEYDWVVKLHTKKNRSWRNQLYFPLMKITSDLLLDNQRSEPTMILPSKWCCTEEWKNKETIKDICSIIGIDYTEPRTFSAGTMFIVNQSYMKLLHNLSKKIPSEKWNHPIVSDGTFSHAFERIFGHIVEDTYKIKV